MSRSKKECPCRLIAEAEAEVTSSDPSMIKVRIAADGCERLWARRLEDGTARLCNCPLSGGYAIGDVVQLDSANNVTGVVQSENVTVILSYWAGGADEDLGQRIFLTLALALERLGCEVEGARPGMAIVCVPRGLPFEKLVNAMRELKVLAHIKITADEDAMPDDEEEGVKFLQQSLASASDLREQLRQINAAR